MIAYRDTCLISVSIHFAAATDYGGPPPGGPPGGPGYGGPPPNYGGPPPGGPGYGSALRLMREVEPKGPRWGSKSFIWDHIEHPEKLSQFTFHLLLLCVQSNPSTFPTMSKTT